MNKLAAVARGDYPADLVVKNARIVNLFTNTYETADVAVYGGTIAGIGEYGGRVEYDAGGRVLIPSFIDGHIHIEDTMMTPANFADLAALHGTGTVLADPHEIANALGMPGLRWLHKASENLPVTILYGAPSCVPASDFETPYRELGTVEVAEMFRTGMAHHLGEMMNFPAVIAGDPDAWAKILLAGKRALTGHAPAVSGKALNAYLSSGINSDHECTTLDEAKEKLSRGMWLMLREGSSFHDLAKLLPAAELCPSRCMAVSDDITATHLLNCGHMDEKLRIMLREGLDEFTALRMITLNPAEYFGLNAGAIAPGRQADFALLDVCALSEKSGVSEVWKAGRLVVKDGEVYGEEAEAPAVPLRRSKVTRLPKPEGLRVRATGDMMRVIGLVPGQAVTECRVMPPLVKEGYAVADVSRDLAKIVCLERHHDTGRYGAAFVQGLGLKRGAIASSVAHDAHNYIAAGLDDESICAALSALAQLGGGLVVVDDGKVAATLALPIGGLMSTLPAQEVSRKLASLEEAAHHLGSEEPHPFMTLSFLGLSVIPELRITDGGLFSVSEWRTVPVFVE